MLECSKEVLEVTEAGEILEIAFSGVHAHGVGKEVGDYVIKTVEADEPAAVVLNFIKFKYVFGDDIGGIVRAFYRKGETTRLRPCVIVARGKTAKSMRTLFEMAQLTKCFDVRFLEAVPEALDYLRSRLRGQSA
jgi:hypothetical protein